MSLQFENTQIAFQAKSNAELRQARFLFASMGSYWVTRLGIWATQLALRFRFPVKTLIKKTLFRQFCGGESLEEANQTAVNLYRYHISVIMDYGVEGKSEEAEFEKTTQNFIRTIEFSADKPYIPFISLKVTGFARFELLERWHANISLSEQEIQEVERVRKRVERICEAAHQYQKMVLIDAEESWIQQPVDDLADEMMNRFNREKMVVYNTFQLYRHDRLQFLHQSLEKARKGGYLLGAKLVRGAYLEKESARAKAMGYPDPMQPDKASCDRDYDAAVSFCLNKLNELYLFIGTHNEQSCRLAAEIMHQQLIPANTERVCFSQLFGMSDHISFNLAKEGFRVAKYLPYGPVEDVIPYLMRRAQENTSVAGQTGRELSLIHTELKRRMATHA